MGSETHVKIACRVPVRRENATKTRSAWTRRLSFTASGKKFVLLLLDDCSRSSCEACRLLWKGLQCCCCGLCRAKCSPEKRWQIFDFTSPLYTTGITTHSARSQLTGSQESCVAHSGMSTHASILITSLCCSSAPQRLRQDFCRKAIHFHLSA